MPYSVLRQNVKKDYLTLIFSAKYMVNLLKKSTETQKVWLY